MKASDVNISEFKSINELYVFLDNHSFELQKNGDILGVWLKYRNHTADDSEKEKAQWEVDCFLHSFHDNKVFPLVHAPSDDLGEINEYPSLTKTVPDIIDYLKVRVGTCASPLLLARYNHLLWKSPDKKQAYALDAVENYIKTIENYCLRFQKDSDRGTAFEIGKYYERILGVSNDINLGFDKIKELTLKLLFHSPELPFHTKHGIVKDMLEKSKMFKQKDFDNVLSIYEAQLGYKGERGDDFFLANEHLPTAIKVAQKTKTDVKKWHDEIGNALLRIAETETEEDRLWLKIDYYSKALNAFKLSGNKEKVNEVQKLYHELKPKVKLPKHQIDYDEETIKQLEEIQDDLRKEAKRLLKFEPHKVYAHIAKGKFFPKKSDVIKDAKNANNSFLQFFSTIYFDNNKNVSNGNDLNAEGDKEVIGAYTTRLKGIALPLMHYTMVYGIQSGHLTAHNFITYLLERTWIGKSFIRYDLDGEPEEINFIPLLIPSVNEYFNQVLAWGASKYYVPNFILCIDSLTLKIEGLLRSFCERINVPTSHRKGDGMEEMLLHNILKNEAIQKYFDEEDLFLFNYLFTSEGANIRNSVAHCFYFHKDYSSDFMLILIAVLLRIGKYNINVSN